MRYTFGDCVVDTALLEISRSGELVPVEPQVWEVLHHLLRHRDRVVSKEELLDSVWGSHFVSEAALSSRIKSVRQAIGDDGSRQQVIRTIRGRGFRFVAQVEERSEPSEPAPTPPGPRRRTVLRPLPSPATTVLGRDAEREAMREALRRSRLLTVLGPGGVGKTTLAVQAAAVEQEAYEDGVCWCDWSSVGRSGSAAGALADALGAGIMGSGSAVDAVVSTIGERRLLLVADNCEHLIDEVAELLLTVVSSCPQVRVLATSRTPLAVPSEALFPLSPLSCETAPDGEPSPAARLFAARARDADPAFTTQGREASVEQLCRGLDGLPLAIELAAARLRTATLDEVLTRIADALQLQAPLMRGRVPRHETLRATIEWSFRLLSEPAQRLLEVVSVFPASFGADDLVGLLTHLAGATTEGLAELDMLVEQSLVVADRSGHSTSYRVLETIRGFGQSRLDSDGLLGLRAAHASWVLAVAEATDRDVQGPDEAEAVARFNARFADLRAAHSHAASVGDADTALRLVTATHYYALHRLRDEAFTWAGIACSLPEAPTHPRYARALGCYAIGVVHRGDLERGRALAERALAACGPDDPDARWPLRALHNLALYEGRLTDGIEAADQELALADRLGDIAHVDAHATAALAHAYGGDHELAMARSTVHESQVQQISNPTQLAWACYARGEILTQADPETAKLALLRAVQLGSSVESRFVVGVALVGLGSTYARLGDVPGSIRTFLRVVKLWRERGDWTHLWVTMRNLVDLLEEQDHPEEAAWLLGASTAPHHGAATFGDSLARLEAARERLVARIGEGAVTALVEAGRSTSEHEVVRRTEAALGDLLVELESEGA